MCGIAGFERVRKDDDGETAARLLGCLHNRGPDRDGWRASGDVVLCQTRLSVIDLSDAVRYPMAGASGTAWLLFNGEIYNHRELRVTLESAGHRFRTRCDAEVVVRGYEEWGVDVLPRLNGMYALAVADEARGELLLARDPRGIKPLAHTTGGRFAFASDAMALVEAGLVAGQPDLEAIEEFAALGYVPPPATGIRGVVQMAPGTLLRRGADGSTTVERWAEPVFAPGRPAPEPVDVADADAVIRAAVERQLAADVPVGVFLSGGVDSALILDCAVEAGARPTALTIGFAGDGDYDETPAAAALASRLGVPHEVETVRAGFTEAIAQVAATYDGPFADSSALATLALARLARRHVTVALSGTGGDDLFAGYHRHRAPRLSRALRMLPGPLRRMVRPIDPGGGRERSGRTAVARSYAARLARASTTDDRALYLDLIGGGSAVPDLLRAPARGRAAVERVAARHGLPAALTLDALQDFELATYLPGDLLVKEDRATMAFSVEGRVPLLDDEVVRLAARTPSGQRAGVLTGKRLLRAVAERRMPDRGRRTAKRGFAVPLGRLMDGPWRAEMREWLHDQPSELADLRAAAAGFERGQVSPHDLWTVTTLAAWEERLARSARPLAGAR